MRNVGSLDRGFRVLLAVAFVIAGIMASGALAIVLYVLAGVMLVTAAVGFCPLYRLVGMNTCRVDATR